MAIRQRKPTTPSNRFTALDDFSDITKTEPEKSLLEPLKKTGGRNNMGRITSRRRGGGLLLSVVLRGEGLGEVVPYRFPWPPGTARSLRGGLLSGLDTKSRRVYILCVTCL